MLRVTFNTMHRNALRDIQRTATDYARAQQQVGSGKRYQQTSENPAGAAIGLRERTEIRALDRYVDANDAVDSRLRVVDSVLSDIIRSIETAQVRATQGRTTVLTAEQREAIALEIEGVREAVLTAVNTSYRGIYVFAGASTTAPPYVKTGSTVSGYQGDTTVVSLDISRTASVAVTVNGGEMMQGSAARDLFETLDALAAAIRAGDMSNIDAGIAELDEAFNRVTAVQGRVGAALNVLPTERARLDELRRASNSRRAAAEEIDLSEAISEMARAKQAQDAALAVTGTNQRMTLLDYLR